MIINNKEIKVKRFSSGEMKLLRKDYIPLAKNNEVTINYDGSIDFFELILIIEFYKDNNIDVNLILTYLPYQRMDKNNGYEANTISYVANIINSLNLKSLQICEPHCDISIFNNSSQISFVEKIFNKVKDEIGFADNDYLIFTDKGSKSKYKHLAKNSVHFEKSRDKSTGLISKHNMIGSISNNAKGIIVDDIISSGDTIISTIELLPKDIPLYIISGHYEKNKYNIRLINHPRVTAIYSSTSLKKTSTGKLKLINIKELLHE